MSFVGLNYKWIIKSYSDTFTSYLILLKAVANGPVSQVLARPLFFKIKISSIFQKASNKQKY